MRDLGDPSFSSQYLPIIGKPHIGKYPFQGPGRTYFIFLIASFDPCATPSTVPFSVLRHHPTTPSSSAFSLLHFRKKTPCT
jgi:hypothetical protein